MQLKNIHSKIYKVPQIGSRLLGHLKPQIPFPNTCPQYLGPNTWNTRAPILATLRPQYLKHWGPNTCNTWALILATLEPQYLKYCGHNTCNTGATILTILRPQYLQYWGPNTCKTGAPTLAILGPQYLHYWGPNNCNTGPLNACLPQYWGCTLQPLLKNILKQFYETLMFPGVFLNFVIISYLYICSYFTPLSIHLF